MPCKYINVQSVIRFKDVRVPTLNNYYNSNLNNGRSPTTPITKSDTIAIKYQSLANKLESDFALQSVFKDVTVDNAAEYFNDNNKTIDEKLYLAKVMYMQRDELAFSIDNIVNNIDNNITKELVRYIYVGNDATIFENSDTYSSDGLIVTSNEDEIITTSDANNKILLNGGDDKLISGKGNDTFYFRKGDGTDTIFDKGGVDILVFDEGITRESVELKLNRNSDLIIALKEDGKTFDELVSKTTPHVSQNYTKLFNINLFQQNLLSQSLKKDIINNSFFIFKNNLHVDMNEVA